MAWQRTRQFVGSERSNGIHRLFWLIVLAFADAVLIPVAAGAGLLFMAIDIAKRLLMDQGASGNGVIMSGLKGIFMWVIDLHKYVLIGRDFPGLIPSAR